jgi:hypothetical protein
LGFEVIKAHRCFRIRDGWVRSMLDTFNQYSIWRAKNETIDSRIGFF